MNQFSHITGFILIAVILMSVQLAAQQLLGQTFIFTVNDGDEVIFRIPANCSNGYSLWKHYGFLAARIDNQLSKSNCSKEEGSPICYTYSVESDWDFGYYYLLNENTNRECKTSNYIRGPNEQAFMVKTGDTVIFRIPAKCSNGSILMKHNGRKLAKIDKLRGRIYDIQLSERSYSKEEGRSVFYTYSVHLDQDFGYYYLVNDKTRKPCNTSYYIKGLDDADMEESTTITTNTPTTVHTSRSRLAPTFISTNALTTISTSGTTAVQTSITVDILQQVLANRTKTATLVKNELHQIESVLEEVINNLTLEVSDLQNVTKYFMEVARNLINIRKAHFRRNKLKMTFDRSLCESHHLSSTNERIVYNWKINQLIGNTVNVKQELTWNNSGAESVINLVDRMVSSLLNVVSNESIQLNFTSPELYVEVVIAVECRDNISFRNRKDVNKEANFAQTMYTQGANTTSYSGVIYYNIGELIDLPTDRGNMSKPVEVLNRKKVQPTIISFTMPGFDGKVLINIKVDNKKHKDPVCVFLDKRENMWSDKGCKLLSYDSNGVRCECNHLTNFAVLMSVMDVSVHENTALNVLSIVSCCISILCLLVTMVIHIVYKRKLTATHSTKVLLLTVLCGVLIFTYILFLAGITKTNNEVVCTAIAIILHFSLLTVFSLMLAIGIDYMIIVVKPLYTKPLGNQMILASFVCPAVIVGISAAATRLNGYGNDKACWLSMENLAKLAFIIPVCFVVCVNMGIVIVMFKAIFNQSTMKKKSGEEKIRTSIRNIFILSPVFGFTWIIGIFAVNKETIAFQYIFVILNGLQGVLIMVCHCVLDPKVRAIVRSRTYRRKLLQESSNQATNATVSTQKSELQSTTAV